MTYALAIHQLIGRWTDHFGGVWGGMILLRQARVIWTHAACFFFIFFFYIYFYIFACIPIITRM